ncbi:hypothetical protein K439DRAFT_123615 [Ramaria rubella]|nr:hypothetical protein K439DRAFT_123615 [Ramaria rubella]
MALPRVGLSGARSRTACNTTRSQGHACNTNSTHAWIADTNNLGRLSYLVLQVYDHLLHRQFRVIPQYLRVNVLSAVQFVHINAQAWLCRLPERPEFPRGSTQPMQISQASLNRIQELIRHCDSLVSAYKTLTGRKKKGGNEGQSEGEE